MNLVKNILMAFVWISVACISVQAQVPQLMRGATRAVAGSAARAAVKQIPLTAAEKELLPANGLPQYSVVYNTENPTESSVAPISREKTPVSIVLDQSFFWINPETYKNLSVRINMVDKPFLEGNAQYIPQYRVINEKLLRHTLKYFMKNMAQAQQNTRLFYSSTPYELITGDVDYAKYLPHKHLDYVFIGETHSLPAVGEEILQLMRVLKESEPNRQIYFVTESLYSQGERTGQEYWGKEDPLKIIYSAEDPFFEIQAGRHKDWVQDRWFLKKLMAQGVALVGLDPYNALVQYIDKLQEEEVISSYVDQPILLSRMWGSQLGLALRNKYWVERILKLRAQEPNALIVVHGGNMHVSSAELLSVSKSLPGESFTLSVINTENEVLLPPIFYDMLFSPVDTKRFENEPETKALFSLRPVDEEAGLTPQMRELFKNTLGADLTLIVHNAKPEMQ